LFQLHDIPLLAPFLPPHYSCSTAACRPQGNGQAHTRFRCAVCEEQTDAVLETASVYGIGERLSPI